MNSDQAEQLGRIEERLIAIDQRFERLDADLYGNGQPGDIDAIKDRLGSLERWRAGIIAVGSFVTAMAGWFNWRRH